MHPESLPELASTFVFSVQARLCAEYTFIFRLILLETITVLKHYDFAIKIFIHVY